MSNKDFFEKILQNKKVVLCEECGCKIFNPNRVNVAHILLFI